MGNEQGQGLCWKKIDVPSNDLCRVTDDAKAHQFNLH
jgi:hypothetical protein